MKRISILILPFIFCVSCIKPVTTSVDADKSKLFRKNLIGISGIASDNPYVEIQHCIDNGMGENIVEKIMVSPPYWFGGQYVNANYDSVTLYMGNDPVNYILELKHDYSEKGAEYLQIINHSENNQIEYFLAGTQDIKADNGKWCKGLSAIECLPSVYYKKAPIYYLIEPQKKYNKNLARSSVECNDIFYFEGNRCGDLMLYNAWSINDIAKLYKAEYNNSKDTVLYIDDRSRDTYGRMFNAINSTEWKNDRLKKKNFYGVIQPKSKLVGDNQFWLIATDMIFESTFENDY